MRSMLMLGSVLAGVVATPAFAQLRSFMLPAGVDPNGTPPGMTLAVLDPGAQQLDLVVWFEDAVGAHPAGLNGYQIIVPWCINADGSGQCLMGGDSGEISYVDHNPGMGGGDSIHVDKNNPQWIFANVPFAVILLVSYNETPPGGPNDPIVGAIYNTVMGTSVDPGPAGDVPSPGGPNYIVQYSFEVRADACGRFTLPFNIPPASPPLSAYFDPAGAAYGGIGAVTFMPLEILVGPLNDDCGDAVDLPPAGLPVAYDTTCASVDGPQGCAAGPDLWYTLTPAVFTDLDVSLSGGGTVATYIGQGCPPAGPPDFCGDVVGQPVLPGTEILIQVIGEDAQGTLFVSGCGCESDADCHDGNPCTDDSCNADCSCSNVPNSLPCDDGNACTLADTCAGGVCQPGPDLDCNDFNPCTADVCDPAAGCSNSDVNGMFCTVDGDCNDPTQPGVDGATCQDQACACTATGPTPADTLRLELRGCDNGPSAVFGACSLANDDECNPGPTPDGILQCSDDDDEPLNGGVCVDQCCFQPGSPFHIDLELGPTPLGVCGGQFFLHYDNTCMTLLDLVTADIDPDGELGWDFVLVNHSDPESGNIDLVASQPPGVPCDDAHASFLGGTVVRLNFLAEGPCKCGGVQFRPSNPPTKVTGPGGDIDIVEMAATAEMQIQGPPSIACPADTTDNADCGTIFRTVTYGPVTVTDDCEEITADISHLCEVEFRKACQVHLDCGRGDLCGPNSTDCGDGFCATDPMVDGAGLTCNGEQCTGYCTIDVCSDSVCMEHRYSPAIDPLDFLDCSTGCQLPPGELTINCTYTNACGRTSQCESRHFNSGLNALVVDVELSPTMVAGEPNDPISRCIDFEISECDAAGFPVCHPPHGSGEYCSQLDQTACSFHPEACYPPVDGSVVSIAKEVVFGLPENIPGHGRAVLLIPPGNWTCLSASDPGHTLHSTCVAECTGTNTLYAAFKGSKDLGGSCHWLVQGNLDGNLVIDIADCAIMAAEYLRDYRTPDTPCPGADGAAPYDFHADFDGDGMVTLADWTFVMFNLSCASKDPCSLVCDVGDPAAAAASPREPRMSMTRMELTKAGLGRTVDAADADGDGVVDLADLEVLFEAVTRQGVPGEAQLLHELDEAVHKARRLQRTRPPGTATRR